MHIVPVEDQTSRRRGIAWRLKDEGQSVDALASGDEAEAFLRQSGCDVVILDINLQGGSGIEVLHRLRARGDPRLVLLLTARDEVADRVAGLDAGADDYLVKPFAMDELMARVRALARWRWWHRDGRLRAAGGGSSLNPSSFSAPKGRSRRRGESC